MGFYFPSSRQKVLVTKILDGKPTTYNTLRNYIALLWTYRCVNVHTQIVSLGLLIRSSYKQYAYSKIMIVGNGESIHPLDDFPSTLISINWLMWSWNALFERASNISTLVSLKELDNDPSPGKEWVGRIHANIKLVQESYIQKKIALAKNNS